MAFYIKQNDTSPGILRQFLDAAGNPVNLTGATVVFNMASPAGVLVCNGKAASVFTGALPAELGGATVTAADGWMRYLWAAADTMTPGEYIAEFQVTFADSSIETAPNSTFETVTITRDISAGNYPYLPPAPDLSLGAGSFATRAELVAWAAGNAASPGQVMHAAGFSYRYIGSGTAISDLPGWVPNGEAYPDHWQVNTTPGTTDMASAISSAMAYVGTGNLRLKNTTYLIGSTILWTTATKIVGENAFFRNDYTNTDIDIRGSVLRLKAGTNANMFTVRADVTGLASGQYPRHHGGLFNVMLDGNRSLDDAVSAVDLNSVGHILDVQGVSYFTIRDVVFFRAAENNINTGSYDYGGSIGVKGCNNLDFSDFATIGAAGSPIEAFGGDSKVHNMVAGYCGKPANISCGPVTGSLFWNMQEHGIILSSGADGHSFSENEVYDCKWAGVYVSDGGDWTITSNNIRNNGRAADGNNNHTCGILVSVNARSATITGNAIFDSDAGTQLRGVYSSGAPKVNLGTNEYNCPTADVSFGDYTNVRYHGKALTTLIKHPGFTADGLIDMGDNRFENVRGLSFGNEKNQSAALTSNTLDCGNYTLVNLSHSAGAQTINDITSSMAGQPIIVIRNSSGITHTITHSNSKLRCLAGANISLTANSAVAFMYVSGTVWQQIGGLFSPGLLTGPLDANGQRITNVRSVSRDLWVSVTSITSNTLAAGFAELVTLNVTGGATINDITSSIEGIPILTIRNTNATSVTITHNTSKLRCNSGANITLAQHQAVRFAFISGTVWQQV